MFSFLVLSSCVPERLRSWGKGDHVAKHCLLFYTPKQVELRLFGQNLSLPRFQTFSSAILARLVLQVALLDLF